MLGVLAVVLYTFVASPVALAGFPFTGAFDVFHYKRFQNPIYLIGRRHRVHKLRLEG